MPLDFAATHSAGSSSRQPKHFIQLTDCGKFRMNDLGILIYAAHSFVSLRLGDDVTALEMAEHLLACERLSDAHKYY